MGLFDRATKGLGGGAEWAAQAAAAQQLANEHLQQAGYTDGSGVTAANAAAVTQAAQADHDVLNAYGQELNRIIAIGQPGSGGIRESVDTGERTAGNPWFVLTVDVTLPGQQPYSVSYRTLLSPQTAGLFAVGSAHEVAVDPGDPHKIALTS